MRKENKSVGASLGKAAHSLCYFLTMLFCALRACDVITLLPPELLQSVL